MHREALVGELHSVIGNVLPVHHLAVRVIQSADHRETVPEPIVEVPTVALPKRPAVSASLVEEGLARLGLDTDQLSGY